MADGGFNESLQYSNSTGTVRVPCLATIRGEKKKEAATYTKVSQPPHGPIQPTIPFPFTKEGK